MGFAGLQQSSQGGWSLGTPKSAAKRRAERVGLFGPAFGCPNSFLTKLSNPRWAY